MKYTLINTALGLTDTINADSLEKAEIWFRETYQSFVFVGSCIASEDGQNFSLSPIWATYKQVEACIDVHGDYPKLWLVGTKGKIAIALE